MPRIARLVIPEYPHHITQRGNYRQDIFLDDSDRKQYLSFIADYSRKFNLEILAYCLMNNHVHFIVIPKKEDSLARTFSVTHTRYSQYFNKKMKVFGHLWQGRFYSCVLDERRLIAAARYVERNPVRAKIVENPIEYAWSSAKNHIGHSQKHIIDTMALLKYIEIEQKKWKYFIDKTDETKEVVVIRRHTKTGRPLGGGTFIQKLEKMLGRRLRALPVGRPKKGVAIK